jgi:hypothetical protein
MPGIFISYRREDTADAAGRLYELLSRYFGDERVFMDVGALEPGVDFVQAIADAVSSCDVLIAVIGKSWLSVRDADGRPRLANPEDFVRLEVMAALDRGIRVIPVLVQGATMPRARDLPDALVRLARRQALELRHTSWRSDVGQLVDTLERTLAPGAAASAKALPDRGGLERDADGGMAGRGEPSGGTPGRRAEAGRMAGTWDEAGPGRAAAAERAVAPAGAMQTIALVTAISWLVGAGIGESLFFVPRLPVLRLSVSIGWCIGAAMAALITGLSSPRSPRRWGRVLAAAGIAALGATVSDAIIYWELRVDPRALGGAIRAPIASVGVNNEYVALAILAMLGGAISGAVGGLLAVLTLRWPAWMSHWREVLVVLVSAAIGALGGVAVTWSLSPPLKYLAWLVWGILGTMLALRQARRARG